jgi:hypothetical protein
MPKQPTERSQGLKQNSQGNGQQMMPKQQPAVPCRRKFFSDQTVDSSEGMVWLNLM